MAIHAQRNAITQPLLALHLLACRVGEWRNGGMAERRNGGTAVVRKRKRTEPSVTKVAPWRVAAATAARIVGTHFVASLRLPERWRAHLQLTTAAASALPHYNALAGMIEEKNKICI